MKQAIAAVRRYMITERIVALSLLLIPVFLYAVAFWPGRMNADTMNEISGIIDGAFSDQHSPILQAVWYPFFHAGFGPGWVLAVQVGVCLAGFYLVLRLVMGRIWAALAAVLIALSPPIFATLGLIGRDPWFLAAMMLVFGAVARLVGADRDKRKPWIALALLGAFAAVAARQNAAFAVVIGLGVAAWLVFDGTRSQQRRVLAAAGAGIGITVLLTVALIPMRLALDTTKVHATAYFQAYDLAGMSIADGRNRLPERFHLGKGVDKIKPYWTPDDVVPLIVPRPGAPVPDPMSGPDAEALDKAWKDRVEADPTGYLAVRMHLFTRQIGFDHPARITFHSLIDGNSFGYHTEFTRANNAANDYLFEFTNNNAPGGSGGLLFKTWIYLLVCVAAVVAAAFRPRRRRVVLGALGLAALTYQVGLFLGAPGVAFRIEMPVVAWAEILIAAAIAVAVQRQRARHGQREGATESG